MRLPSIYTIHPFVVPLIGIATLFLTLLCVFLLWRTPLIATFPIAILCCGLLLFIRSKKVTIVACTFALFGVGHEAFFVARGLWSYAAPTLWGVPAYLPFVWALIAILCIICLKIILLQPLHSFTHTPPRGAIGAWTLLLIVSGIFGTLAIPTITSTHVTILFLLFDGILLLVFRSVPLALTGLIAFVGGTCGDLLAMHYGVWYYPSGGLIFGIPGFIFVGWDLVGLLCGAFYITLDTVRMLKKPEHLTT